MTLPHSHTDRHSTSGISIQVKTTLMLRQIVICSYICKLPPRAGKVICFPMIIISMHNCLVYVPFSLHERGFIFQALHLAYRADILYLQIAFLALAVKSTNSS